MSESVFHHSVTPSSKFLVNKIINHRATGKAQNFQLFLFLWVCIKHITSASLLPTDVFFTGTWNH